MGGHLEKIAMNIGSSIHVHTSSDHGVVKEDTDFFDIDVNYWLEARKIFNMYYTTPP